ncbi:MAG TPA: DNA repair exonuclease [Polyangiaceae bacterium]|jgi:DNA repair exonuclease SbcCD nuclease subunit|nr:DNA repair exonuclease [Polyangiaceae bacterium]
MTSPKVKLVHAADLHLDSPMLGLERYPGAPVDEVRGATRRAFEGLVDLCLAEDARLLLIAGDVYDGDWKDYSTGLFFVAQLNRLREIGARVVVVRGNHDAGSQITRHLRLPDHVLELPHARPVTHVFEELGVAVHGQSFRDRSTKSDLASGYPDGIRGALNIGILHTSVTGRPGHDDYAPCTLDTLVRKEYDYFALGHVHRREVLSRAPWVVFPGNLQGRHMKETGPKGATLIDVDGGRVTSVEHRTLDVVRWTVCEVDARDADAPDDVLDRARAALGREVDAAEGRTLAARVVVHGASRAHAALQSHAERWEAELRAAATEFPDELFLERVVLDTRAELDVERLAERRDALGQVARAMLTLRTDADARSSLLAELGDLKAKLPSEVRDGVEAVELDDGDSLLEALADVEQMLLPSLAALGSDD